MTSSDLIYDPATHTSRTPDGRDVPHVTHILKACGISADFEALAEMSRRIGDAIEAARILGTVVHEDAHAYDDGDLDLSTVHELSRPYLDAWATFRAHLKLQPLGRERRIYHPVHDYTGKYDGIFHQTGSGKRILVDIKIGDPDDAGCRFQLAAYEAAHLGEHPDETIDERWGVRLQPDLAIPYRIFNYSDRAKYPDSWRDFQAFQSFLVTYRHQHARRRAA